MKRFARLLSALVFLASGLLKLEDPARFLLDIQSLHFLPYPMAWAAAFFVPWLEVLTAIALLTERLVRGAIALLLPLTAVFIVVLVAAEVRGIDTACGCFGEWLVFPSTTAHVIFNLLLMAALTLGWPNPKTPPPEIRNATASN